MSAPSRPACASAGDLLGTLRRTGDQTESLDQLLDTLDHDQLCELVRELLTTPPTAVATMAGAGEATVDRICDLAVQLAAAAFGVEPTTVLSRDRHRPIADARAVAQAVARSSGLTLTAIAEYFSQHHTNVMHSIRKVASSPRLQTAAERIGSELAAAAFTTGSDAAGTSIATDTAAAA